MSHPGSKNINKIDFTQLKFLTNTNTVSSTLDGTNFDSSTGKPLYNMALASSSEIDPFFLSTVENNFSERQNINKNLIYNYPQLVETDTLRDIQITNETIIDSVFISEGASMQNMFGYYMYTVDEQGYKKLLSTDDSNNPDGYYYDPTIIFPHVYSIPSDNSTIQKGNMRRLKGNLANGNFQNIYVGFFLVPHGWYAHVHGTLVTNDKILYSTVDFNSNYINTEYQMVNDKIYSVYFKAESTNGDELLLTGFEDMFSLVSFDYDYNDCIVGIKASDTANIVDYDLYAKVFLDTQETYNNIMFIDPNGEFVRFDPAVYDLPSNENFTFERHMYFDNADDRDEMSAIYDIIHGNYRAGKSTDNSFGQYKLITVCLFRKNDIANSQKNGKKELYLYESKHDRFSNLGVERYKKQLTKNLQNSNYYERYILKVVSTGTEIISLDSAIDRPRKVDTNKFRVIGNGIMDCINGKAHLPSNTSQIYTVFKKVSSYSKFIINIKMHDHPSAYKNGTKYFVRYVSFQYDNECIVVDLGTMDIYVVDQNQNLILNNNPSMTNITVGSIVHDAPDVKELINVFRNDSDAFYRKILLGGTMVFYCVRLPRVKNNPTVVFLDSNYYMEWNDTFNTISGTYFTKQKFYKVDNFME